MRRGLIVILVLIAAAAVFGCQFRSRGVDAATTKISRQIRSDLKTRDMPNDAPWRDRRTQSLARAFYARRSMRPAWTTGAGPLPQAGDLVEVLAHANEEGLNPEDYSAAAVAADRKKFETNDEAARTPKALAEFDLLCTIAAFHYMSDVFDGRISPKALDATWVTDARRGNLDSLLNQALDRNQIKPAFADLAPSQAGYRRLREARARYAAIVAGGGWPTIAPGRPLARGARGARVTALRARLIASGDLDSRAAASETFDTELDSAIRKFQGRYGNDADGVVRATELAELDVPAASRLRQIELNMERWRWVPKSFGDRYLLVNIPEYALHVYESGKSILDMRVVVGKALTATPVFSDQMTTVVINPNWNVPASIVHGEIAPEMQKDQGYLVKHHMRIFNGETAEAQEVDASTVNWSDSTAFSQIRVRQDPGEANALGPIKFLFPNQFDVYLHGTPAGHLFSLEERSFSHGCVRVEDPIKLAGYVLRGTPEADSSRIKELIAAGATTALKVPQPLAVHIVYFTAFVEENGVVGFRKDVYGIDQQQAEELQARTRVQESQKQH